MQVGGYREDLEFRYQQLHQTLEVEPPGLITVWDFPDAGAKKALVGAGRVPQARIDDAVRRILKQKVSFKLWERPFTDRALTADRSG